MDIGNQQLSPEEITSAMEFLKKIRWENETQLGQARALPYTNQGVALSRGQYAELATEMQKTLVECIESFQAIILSTTALLQSALDEYTETDEAAAGAL